VSSRQVQDVNDLMQYLIDVWAGVEHSVIDDAIDHHRRRIHAYIRARRKYFQYLLGHKFSQNVNV